MTRDYAAESAACDAAYLRDATDQAARVPHPDPDELPVPVVAVADETK